MYIMSKARSMYAGSSGSNYGVNKNSPGNGNGKWQGLWPTVGHAQNARHINIEAGGDNRNVVFCMNQLGGVGKTSNMFATTADGVQDCKNGKLHWTGPYIPRTFNEFLKLADKNNDDKLTVSEVNNYGLDGEAWDLNNDGIVSSNDFIFTRNALGRIYNLQRDTGFCPPSGEGSCDCLFKALLRKDLLTKYWPANIGQYSDADGFEIEPFDAVGFNCEACKSLAADYPFNHIRRPDEWPVVEELFYNCVCATGAPGARGEGVCGDDTFSPRN